MIAASAIISRKIRSISRFVRTLHAWNSSFGFLFRMTTTYRQMEVFCLLPLEMLPRATTGG
jgi:hypothetical protein